MIHFQIRKKKQIKSGYNKKDDEESDDAFDLAWLKHIHRNKHHWQYWVLIEDDEANHKTMEMPDKYKKEMLADWRGAGKAQGFGDDVLPWFLKNEKSMILHPNTRKWIKNQLGL